MLLLGALAIASFFAACITGWIVAAYATYRFAIIISQAQNLPQGLKVSLSFLSLFPILSLLLSRSEKA